MFSFSMPKKLTMGLALAAMAFSSPAFAAAEVGSKAPDFTATTVKGEEISLSDFEGKNVVLEWTNHKCPFVVKHYKSGNMQKLQKTVTDEGAVWISIVSSAPEKQGHLTPEESMTIDKENGSSFTHKILDESGEIGQAYGAKTTPHMYVINPEGTLVYAGAIDSIPDADPASAGKGENYVMAALDNISEGEEVAKAATAPYGCSVKY